MFKYLYDPHMPLYDLSVLIKNLFCSVLFYSDKCEQKREVQLCHLLGLASLFVVSVYKDFVLHVDTLVSISIIVCH